MSDELRTADLALPWAAVMPDDDLHNFLNDLVAAAMHRWHHEPDVPDRDVLAFVERVCAQWRTPGQGFRSDAEKVDRRLTEIHGREQSATRGTWGTYYDGAVYHLAADMRVAAPWSGQPIGEIPDGDDKTQAFHNAMFIGRARDDVSWLVAELTEARIKLEIAERRNDELADTLAEREVQIAGLLADVPDLSDDQAGVPV